MTIRWQRANWPSKLPRNLITTKFSNSVNRFVTILHAFRNRNESSFWCKQSHRLPKTSKFELHLIIQNLKTAHEIRKTLEKSNDRFDKHTKIHDFKLLDKVLIKSNKTQVSLELEKIKSPFYLSEIGRPLSSFSPQASTRVSQQSSVGSFLLTRPIQFHPLRLIFELILFFLCLCYLQNCCVRDMLMPSYLYFWGTWP